MLLFNLSPSYGQIAPMHLQKVILRLHAIDPSRSPACPQTGLPHLQMDDFWLRRRIRNDTPGQFVTIQTFLLPVGFTQMSLFSYYSRMT